MDSELYSRLLFIKKLGHALFLPQPPTNLPRELQIQGTQIGDVGVVTKQGSFDRIFNILHGSEHQFNQLGVPNNFEPLTPAAIIKEEPHEPGSSVSNAVVEKRRVTMTAGVEDNIFVPASAGAEIEVSTNSNQMAVLLLPDGASSWDLQSLESFMNYADKHSDDWYRFVNGVLGRRIANGDLRLVTGVTKTPSWHVAVTERSSSKTKPSLKLKAVTVAHAGASGTWSWNESTSGRNSGPRRHQPQDGEDWTNSQTVFLRSYGVYTRHGLPKAVPITDWRQSKEEVPYAELFSGQSPPAPGDSGALNTGTLSAHTDRPRTEGADPPTNNVDSLNLVDIQYHPSRAIYRHLLDCAPDATVAIIHDNDWVSLINEDDDGLPTDNEFISRIADKFDIATSETGGVFLQPRSASGRKTPGEQESQGLAIQLESADPPLPSRSSGEMTQAFPSNNVFALIIGINDYRHPSFLPLRGAVNDARAFQKYLLDSYDNKGVQVLPQNILLIENENATRSAILDGFKSHFLENKDIPDHGGATMIFFFAGYGSLAPVTGNLITHDLVETMCPVDERTTNAAGEYVHTIPHYVLGGLIWQLAEKKGQNITVILDSSNSGVRGFIEGIRATIGHSHPSPPELDSDGEAQFCSPWNPSATSHVLLAACRPYEIAEEVDYQGVRRGRFTTSLIGLLRWARLSTTTYKELMSRTEGWSGQHPYCGGSTDRLIFDGNYPATGPSPPGSTRIPTSSELFSVAMGAAEGVVPGTEFAAYDANNKFLCTFVAQSVEVAKTTLVAADQPSLPVLIPRGSRAVVSDWKNPAMILRVHTSADFLYTTHLFPKVSNANRLRRFVQAKADEAQLIIRTDEKNSKIVLEPCEGTTMRKAQREMRFSLGNPAHLPDAMDGVAHFNYFLERSNKEDPLLEVPPNNGVRVPGFALEMHRLLGDFPTRKPDPSVGLNGNMVVDGAVRFVSEEGARYGFTICNTSPEDLYPYLFYFDPETFTIQDWYLPEGSHVEAPLPSGKRLTLGMGGERAFEFTLSAGQEESSGFLKLFVAREFIDLKWIKQGMSPFHPQFVGTGRLEMKHERLNYLTWDALTVTLTMTR
ncbi:hypothetical protein B0H13DRAFT_2655156 [Mycena leptocephala]|nr:hypothetical protein B0H13DRAFT_2655156 [Mycena leptocephala]